jgi:hypothetical protein
LPPINEFKPPYQSKNNRIRAGRETGDVVTCQRATPRRRVLTYA